VPVIPLELAIDASGMHTGAGDAERSMESIIAKSYETEKALGVVSQQVRTTGASMHESFSAAKGGLKLTAGLAHLESSIAGVTAGTKGLDGALRSAAKSTLMLASYSNVLRDLSTNMRTVKTVSTEAVRDMMGIQIGTRAIETTSRVAVTGLQGLWLTIKANPLMMLVTALGMASMAISWFGDKTKDAGKEVKDTSAALNSMLEMTREMTLRTGYGQPNPRQSVAGTIDALVAIDAAQRESYEWRHAPGVFGLNEMQMREALAGAGYEEWMAYSHSPASGQNVWRMGQSTRISRAQMMGAGEYLLRQRQTARPVGRGPTGNLLGPMGAESLPLRDPYYGRSDLVSIDVHDRNRIEEANRKQAEQEKASLEHMREMAALSRQVGDYLGDAAADFAMGLRTAKQLLAGLLADLARMGFRAAATQLTQTFLNSFGRSAPTATVPDPGPNLVLPQRSN